MSTRFFNLHAARFVVAVGCALTAASCGGDLMRTGRAPVILVIDSLAAGQPPVNPVLSDVGPTVFNDVGVAQIRAIAKDQISPGVITTPINDVTLTRYRVSFRRADGRNTPGVDVPFSFDGGLSRTIGVGGSEDVSFDLVRHAAKLEPPLRSLNNLGGQVLITTVAEVTFFGRDQNGNEVSVTGLLDVTFGDFPDAP